MYFRMGTGEGKAHIKDILLYFKITGKYPKIWRNQKETSPAPAGYFS